MSILAHTFAIACSSINPYIYLILNGNVRNRVKNYVGMKMALTWTAPVVNLQQQPV